ncbi:MAG: histidine kinase [Desulfosporosinus sp. BRH_c37]|nr:MAG: histidine kinase [Desulfosporosinus sp. BRH_c37]
MGNGEDVIEELTRQNTRMSIIQQIVKRINVEMSYEDILDEVSAALHKVLPYDLLSCSLIEKGQLIIKATLPKDPIVLGVGWVLDNNNSAPWKAVRDKRCYLRQDIWHDPHKRLEDDAVRQIGIKSGIMAPLLFNNEVIGVLICASEEPFSYRENDCIFVQQLADAMAVCINNTRLFAEVLKSKREWEETFKAVPDRLFLIDLFYNVLRSNNQDYVKKADNDLKCYEIFTCCGDQCHLCPTMEAFRTGQASIGEFTHTYTKNIYTISAYPVYNEKNELYGMTVYVQDVTDKRKMETQLFQSGKLAALGEMAAGVAHELNSPLTAIIGNASLILRSTSTDDKYLKLLENIKSCGQRSKHIIQNLLTFSRQNNYKFEQVSINEVVEGSLSLVSYQIEKDKIAISKYLMPRIPLFQGNKQQLEQVIINFLLNARDALEGLVDGRIEISTDMRADAETGCTVVETKVADNGMGISESSIGQIFTPFFTTKEKTRGTGLGLSVSLGIAQTHGGRIDVSSGVGRGSIFSLIIPL